MKDFIIMTDGGCDLTTELVDEIKIAVVPFGLCIENKEYKHYPDCRELSMEEFYKKIQAGHIGKTSGVNLTDAEQFMREYAEKNIDILFLSFSSGMSSSYQIATMAADEVKKDYPDVNIQVIDTLSGSSGEGLLVYLAAKEKEKGKSMSEVVDFVMNNRLNISHCFVVDNLMYIQKAGRISSLSAIVGAAIGIRPVFKLDNDGKVALDKKVKGKKNAVKHLIEKTKEAINADLFFICHANAENEANELYNKIKELYPKTIIKINEISPVVGNNTGPGTIGIMFLGKR